MKKNERLLAKINAGLCERTLDPLGKLGLAKEGEIEIGGEPKIIEAPYGLFYDCEYPVIYPGGSTGSYWVRVNAKRTAVVLPILNGTKTLLSVECRLPLGQRLLHEAARSFGSREPNASLGALFGGMSFARETGVSDTAAAHVRSLLWRKFGERAGQLLTIRYVGILALGVAENSGTHSTLLDYYFVTLAGPEDSVREFRGGETLQKVRASLWNLEDAYEARGRAICDNHSIVALSLHEKKCRELQSLL